MCVTALIILQQRFEDASLIITIIQVLSRALRKSRLQWKNEISFDGKCRVKTPHVRTEE